MLSIDDNFLEQLGLGSLPAEDKPSMREHIYDTLEMRVGIRLANGMKDNQLEEFEGLVSGDASKGRVFLANITDWESDQRYQASLEAEKRRASEQSTEPNIDGVVAEFAALKWLEINFPSYKEVVNEELEKLKAEILAAAPQILSESQANRQA